MGSLLEESLEPDGLRCGLSGSLLLPRLQRFGKCLLEAPHRFRFELCVLRVFPRITYSRKESSTDDATSIRLQNETISEVIGQIAVSESRDPCIRSDRKAVERECGIGDSFDVAICAMLCVSCADDDFRVETQVVAHEASFACTEPNRK
jgi:hypothetical protein